MALDPAAARDPGLPRGQGPAAVLRGRGQPLQPAAASAATRIDDDIPIMLIDEAETVDDAEHERLMAKAAAEGIEPTFERMTACRTAGSTRSGCSMPRPALPEQIDGGGRAAAGRRRAARRRRDRQRARAGHGRQRRRRRPARSRRRPVHAGARRGGQGLRAAVVRRRAHPRVRHVVLGRHRGDASSAAETAGVPAAPGRRRDPRGRDWAISPPVGTARSSRSPTASPCPGPGSAPSPSRRWSSSSASGSSPGRREWRRPRRRAAADAAGTSWSSTATRPSELARRIGRTCPDRLRRRRARRGGRAAVEDRGQRERQGRRLLPTGSRSCATTRSAGGASTAT